jgi:twinkle protein
VKINTDRLHDLAVYVGMENPNFSGKLDIIMSGIEPILRKAVILAETFPDERDDNHQILSSAADALPFTIFAATIDRIMDEAKDLLEEDRAGSAVGPMEEIESVYDFYDNGFDAGIKLNSWPHFSEHYRIARRELNVVTGYYGSGKSEFLDAIGVELALQENWKFAIFSPENFPHAIHYEKWLSKYNGKPFHRGPTERMNKIEVAEGMNWVHDHVVMLHPHEDNITLDSILSLAKKTNENWGIDGLIIDPWNEISHAKPRDESETDYIGRALMLCRRFARNNNIALWIAAHPYKPIPKEDGTFNVPTPYSISGSAHWANKSDNCLTVFRKADSVEIHIQKIKFKMRGEVGVVNFKYDKINGRYEEINDSIKQEGF